MSLIFAPFVPQDPSTAPTVNVGTVLNSPLGVYFSYAVVDIQNPNCRSAPAPLSADRYDVSQPFDVTLPAYADPNERLGYVLLGSFLGINYQVIGEIQPTTNFTGSTISLGAVWTGNRQVPDGIPLTELGQFSSSAQPSYEFYGYVVTQVTGLSVTLDELNSKLYGKLSLSITGVLPNTTGDGTLNLNYNKGVTYNDPRQSSNYLPINLSGGSVIKFRLTLSGFHNDEVNLTFNNAFRLSINGLGRSVPAEGYVSLPPCCKFTGDFDPANTYTLFTVASGVATLNRTLMVNIFDRTYVIPGGYAFLYPATNPPIYLNTAGDLFSSTVVPDENRSVKLFTDSVTPTFCFYSGNLTMGVAGGTIVAGQMTYYTGAGVLTTTPNTVPAGVALNDGVLGTAMTVLSHGVVTSKTAVNQTGFVVLNNSIGASGWVLAKVG
jgi:hypothetical protein